MCAISYINNITKTDVLKSYFAGHYTINSNFFIPA